MKELTIRAGSSEYTAKIGRGLRKNIAAELKAQYPKARFAVITDETVLALYGGEMLLSFDEAGMDYDIIPVPPGEKSKSICVFGEILNELAAMKYNRGDVIVALGGGVVGDLSGFIAASYLRGVAYVQVPTTLLSQIDSSVGGKTAVNLPEGKNLAGAFYHPHVVYIDLEFLQTLRKHDFADGMAELIKDAMIKDAGMVETLEQSGKIDADSPILEDLVVRCLEIKRDVVAQDERDKGERMKLNYGHTIGHALERMCAQDGTQMSHGQGVARGMAAITAASERLGQTETGTTARLTALLKTAGLPADIDGFDKNEILSGIFVDKKNVADTLNIILVSKPGKSFIHRIGKTQMRDYL